MKSKFKLLLLLAITTISAPAVTISYEQGASNQIVLSWETVPGRAYNLLATDRLSPPSWAALNPSPFVATTNRQVYRDSNNGAGRYYRVVELSPSVVVTLVGISEQAWQASDVWVPATQSRTISGSKLLLTLGCWWDEHYITTLLPTDSNGVFFSAINKNVGLADAPVQVQVGYQVAAATGSHSITPPVIGGSGDGFFLLLEVAGLSASLPVRDSGRSRISHPIFGYNDPNTIESITVATDGTAAQVGDLAVAIFVMDPIANPDINISLPAGWTSLGFNDAAVDNVGYRACYKLVTTSGQQSVTCNWTDGSTFVAEAAIVVFKAVSAAP